jgi:hypothetical protein
VKRGKKGKDSRRTKERLSLKKRRRSQGKEKPQSCGKSSLINLQR